MTPLEKWLFPSIKKEFNKQPCDVCGGELELTNININHETGISTGKCKCCGGEYEGAFNWERYEDRPLITMQEVEELVKIIHSPALRDYITS